MSETKLPRVLTAAAVASLLFLTSAAGNAVERPHWQPAGNRGFEAPEGRRWGILLELLPHLWQKAVSRMAPEDGLTEKVRSEMDPNGLIEKVRSEMDPNG